MAGNDTNDSMAERMDDWDLVQFSVPDLKKIIGVRPEYTGQRSDDTKCFFKKTVDKIFIGYVSGARVTAQWSLFRLLQRYDYQGPKTKGVESRNMLEIVEYDDFCIAPIDGWRDTKHHTLFREYLKQMVSSYEWRQLFIAVVIRCAFLCFRIQRRFKWCHDCHENSRRTIRSTSTTMAALEKTIRVSLRWSCCCVQATSTTWRPSRKLEDERDTHSPQTMRITSVGSLARSATNTWALFRNEYDISFSKSVRFQCFTRGGDSQVESRSGLIRLFAYGRPGPEEGWMNQRSAKRFENWLKDEVLLPCSGDITCSS